MEVSLYATLTFKICYNLIYLQQEPSNLPPQLLPACTPNKRIERTLLSSDYSQPVWNSHGEAFGPSRARKNFKLWLFGRLFTGSNRSMSLLVLWKSFLVIPAFLLILLAWRTVVKRFLDRDTYSAEVSFHSMNDTHYLLYFNKIRFPEAYSADLTEQVAFIRLRNITLKRIV